MNPPAARTPDDSAVLLAHIMSDHDTNLYGTVHGGVVMKLIDDAAAAAAGRHAGITAVTVATAELVFVAIDRDRRPAAVPELKPETDEDRERFRRAQERREARRG